MSKDQPCSKCLRDFVGSDLGIGMNHCPECDNEIHADCCSEIAALKSRLAEADGLLKGADSHLPKWSVNKVRIQDYLARKEDIDA